MTGTIYTETLIHSAPEAFLKEAPYQLVIVTLSNGERVTGRIVAGSKVSIDDAVELVETREGVPFFQKSL